MKVEAQRMEGCGMRDVSSAMRQERTGEMGCVMGCGAVCARGCGEGVRARGWTGANDV